MPLYQKEIFMSIAVNKIVKGKGNAPCVYIGALAFQYMNSDEIQHANSAKWVPLHPKWKHYDPATHDSAW